MLSVAIDNIVYSGYLHTCQQQKEAAMAARSSIAALRRSLTALRALLADPDDLPQVFTVLEAFDGSTLPRMERRMDTSESGRRLLDERPDIVPRLEDREALRRMP